MSLLSARRCYPAVEILEDRTTPVGGFLGQVGDAFSSAGQAAADDLNNAAQVVNDYVANPIRILFSNADHPVDAATAAFGAGIYPSAAAVIQGANGAKPGDPLPALDRMVLRHYFGGLVDRVRVTWDATLVTIPNVGGDVEAMTFGFHIYVAGNHMADRERLSLLSHELVHVAQFERFGESLPRFGFEYGKGFSQGGFSYEDNPLEQEAYLKQYALTGVPGPHTDPTPRDGQVLQEYRNLTFRPDPNAAFCFVGVDAVFSIQNDTHTNLRYRYRWSANDPWIDRTIRPGHVTTFSLPNDCGLVARRAQIVFDDGSNRHGIHAVNYTLDTESLPTGIASPRSSVTRGRTYSFQQVRGRFDLFQA